MNAKTVCAHVSDICILSLCRYHQMLACTLCTQFLLARQDIRLRILQSTARQFPSVVATLTSRFCYAASICENTLRSASCHRTLCHSWQLLYCLVRVCTACCLCLVSCCETTMVCLQVFRSSSAFDSFLKRWKLSIYFSLRFQVQVWLCACHLCKLVITSSGACDRFASPSHTLF